MTYLISILRPEWEEIIGQLYAQWQFGDLQGFANQLREVQANMGVGEMPMNMDDLIVEPEQAPKGGQLALENGPEERALTPPPMSDPEDK